MKLKKLLSVEMQKITLAIGIFNVAFILYEEADTNFFSTFHTTDFPNNTTVLHEPFKTLILFYVKKFLNLYAYFQALRKKFQFRNLKRREKSKHIPIQRNKIL